MKYTIRETHDGRFIVARESGEILVSDEANCRSTSQCFVSISEDWLNGDMSRHIEVDIYIKGDED